MSERTICHILDKVLYLESLETRVISLENKNLQLEEKNYELEKVLEEFRDLKVKFEELKQFIKGKIEEVFEDNEDQMEMDGSTTDSIESLDLEDQNISSETETESPNKENFVKIEDSFESPQNNSVNISTPISAVKEKLRKVEEIQLKTPEMPKLIISEDIPSTSSKPLKDLNGMKMAKIDIKREVEIKKEAEKIQDIYPCTHCLQYFSRSSALSNHMKCHSKKPEFKCTTCSKNFPHPGALYKHIQSHLGDKSYECPEPNCLQKFKTKSQLSAHKVIHRNVKNKKIHKCLTCEKEFSFKHSLKRHYLVHTGEKPYSCLTCKKSFTHRTSLIHHSKTQH